VSRDLTVADPPAAAPPSEPRGSLAPLLVLLAVIGVVVGGGYVAGAALAEPAGPPVSVGGVVRLQPLSGWVVAGSLTPGHVRLTRGGGNLDTIVVGGASDPSALLRRYLTLLGRSPAQLSVSPDPQPVTLDSGVRGLRVFYVGTVPSREVTSIEGEVTAVVTPHGDGVILDGWAPKGLFSYVEHDLERMTGTARIAAPGARA
jgi:hypothetical protein